MKNYFKMALRVGVLMFMFGAGSAGAQIFNVNIENVSLEIAQQNCLSDAQIQQAVANSQILPLNIVLNNAGIAKGSKVLPPIAVCDVNGVLFYQFSILDKNGKASKLVLPATSPLS